MSLLDLLRDSLSLVALGVLLVVVVLAWALLRFAGRRQAVPAWDDDPTLDLSASPDRPGLRRPFRQARAAIRRAFTRQRTGLPKVLVLGPSEAGKTTLLARSSLGYPFGQPRQKAAPDHAGVNWFALDGGIVLDIVGEDVLRPDGLTSDDEGWRAILRRIKRASPRRPADGVVLTLPASYFVEPAKPQAQILAEASRRGTLLSRKLERAQKELGMQLPVYLLVSHCDLIPGFSDLVGRTTEAARQQILGWSNPLSPSTPYNGALVEQAFDTVVGDLETFQLRALALEDGETPTDAFVQLPRAFKGLLDPLKVYATHLFSPRPGVEAMPFRGLYFSGDVPRGGDELPAASHQQIAFIGDLFENKVFSEASLAAPTVKAQARAFRWRLGMAACGLALGVWAVLGLTLGAPRVAESARQVVPFLRGVVSSSAAPKQADPASARASALRYLASASAIERFALRSWMLPGSALSELKPETDRLVEQSLETQVLSPIRTGLVREAENLVRPSPPQLGAASPVGQSGSRGTATDRVVVYPIERYPEFDELRNFSRRLAQLDDLVENYNLFTSRGQAVGASVLEEFGRLTESSLRARLAPRGAQAGRYFSRRLRRVEAVPFEPSERELDRRMETRVRALGDRFFDAIFEHNPLLSDLDEVLADWIGGAPNWRQGPLEAERYKQLYANLLQLERHLSLPELQWTATDTLDLGPEFDAIRQIVHESPFLGPEVSALLTREALDRFDQLREHLQIYATSDTGALLQLGDGTWSFTSELQAVSSGLQELLGQPFMQGECSPSADVTHADGRTLFWDPLPLEKAVQLFAAYESWDGTEELPDLLQSTAPQVTRETIAERVNCLVADAQEYEYPLLSDDRGLIEADLLQQVQNLQAVEPSLAAVLDALGRLNLRADQTRLAQLLRSQRLHILSRLSRLLEMRTLYEPQGGDFGAWQGDPGPALVAFGAASADELNTYLASQLDVVRRLATEQAQPTLGFLASSGSMGRLGTAEPARFWGQVVGALDAYDSKQAGNAISRLEDFVQTLAAVEDPGLFDLYSCWGPRSNAGLALRQEPSEDAVIAALLPEAADLQVLSRQDLWLRVATDAGEGWVQADKANTTGVPAAVTAGGNFFLRRRSELRSMVLRRCGELADAVGYQLYVGLGTYFNDRLWGRFPFADADANYDAEPAMIRSFFGVDFQHARILIENLPPASERFGDSREAVRRFMRQMERTRFLFAPFLAVEAKDQVPIYDIEVRFRVQRTKERGANQIISWLMSVGEEAEKGDRSANGEKVIDLLNTRSVSPASGAQEPAVADGRWVYGKPVTLALRWAADSTFSPYAPADGVASTRWSVDGKTLLYRFREPWSLLRLLVKNKTLISDGAGVAPDTLRVNVQTVSAEAPEPRSAAELFLQISLLSPDEGKRLAVPDFYIREAPLTSVATGSTSAGVVDSEPASSDPAQSDTPADEDASAGSASSDDESEPNSDSSADEASPTSDKPAADAPPDPGARTAAQRP